MDKEQLLKRVADKAYDVGFGAKKSFASFEIITKGPGWISYVSIAAGVLALVFPFFSIKLVSVIIILVGIAGLNLEKYAGDFERYEEAGKRLTVMFNQLRDLAAKIEGNKSGDFSQEIQELSDIEAEYYKASVSNQVFPSDWMAHYKFFRQMQYEWIEKYRPFRPFKDKVPASLVVFVIGAMLFLGLLILNGGAENI